jgi:uroporphyrin-III C-methyltransferase/precorrin-2 dehydrogenase/sirohydrochlorin ferrochelatase
MSAYYPVALDVAGRSCVVIGGNPLAVDKAEGLLRAGARVTLIAAQVEADVVVAAAEGRLTWVPRDYVPGDLEGAWLAIDASGVDGVNAAVRDEAAARHVLLNVVDRAHLCDWIAPAVVRRGPLQIAVTTSGESPFLASALRRRLEQDLGQEWEPFTRMVGAVRRRLRAEGVPMADQEAVYAALLRSDLRQLLREGDQAAAEALVEALVGNPRPGRVWLVGGGPGGPGLLTMAAREALAGADVVLHDALVDSEVLGLANPRARVVAVGKRAGGQRVAQEAINALLLEEARHGREVVRLKGGDPFVFARGGEEAAFLAEAGVEVRVIPGVSAATAAPALAGIPLTLRGVSSSVAFITARGATGQVPELGRLAAEVDTLVVLMALGALPETARRLAAALGVNRPAAVVAEAGTRRQRVVRADLGSIAQRCQDAGVKAPATLVVGEVASAVPAARRHRSAS